MALIDATPVLKGMDRIATALERIADGLEKEYHVSLEQFTDVDGAARITGDIKQCGVS